VNRLYGKPFRVKSSRFSAFHGQLGGFTMLVWGDSDRDSEHARRIRKQKLRCQWFARRLELKARARNVVLETKKLLNKER
jgi:hypothetical protein